MKRANIIIKGKVQMAGFRTFIKNTADSLNVTGFADINEKLDRFIMEFEKESGAAQRPKAIRNR